MNALGSILISLAAVLILVVLAIVGSSIGLQSVFGIVLPYLAIVVFLVGFVWRVLRWAKSPVPYNIPTSCGQQNSLPWIKQNKIEAPSTKLGVFVRMAMEVLFFRSLFRNTRAEITKEGRLVHDSSKYLWAAGLAFHYSFLVIFLRHMRLFSEPVPFFVHGLEFFDAFFEIAVPALYLTDLIIVGAISYLFLRRVVEPKLRTISLPADYFALFLLLGIVLSGILMRYFTKVDIVGVKNVAMGWVNFNPVVVDGLGAVFYVHIFLVCCLFLYFPFSKLMHMGGVFLSPTRNMLNNSRERLHVNPWNPEVKPHTYDEWEEEFHDVLVAAGYPLDKKE